ncbi:MAG TPA: DUF3108 domain-containing protein [Thermoanaerobaculia bacterium]|nr:DUF3108 domain-containing protein [Thermoanaerobaculia bacterium]
MSLLLFATLITNIFAAGETLDYELSWIGVAGGHLRMTIGPQPQEPAHFKMTSVAQSSSSFAFLFKVRDEITSIVNVDDFSTIRYEKHLNERGRYKDDITTIDERRKIATRRRPNHNNDVVPVPKPVFDPLSLVFHLRDLPLQPGTVERFTVFADGKVYTLEARVTKRESLSTPAGNFNTVVVQPKMLAGGLFRGEGDLTIWYTDDPRHIPVRIRSDLKVGSIVATLRSVRTGVSSPQPQFSK